MYLDDQIREKDVMAKPFGVKLVLDKMSAPYVSQATIDFADTSSETTNAGRPPPISRVPTTRATRSALREGAKGEEAHGQAERRSGNDRGDRADR
jgi:hypothetical protein